MLYAALVYMLYAALVYMLYAALVRVLDLSLMISVSSYNSLYMISGGDRMKSNNDNYVSVI